MFVQKKEKICKLTIIFLAVWTTFLFTGCEAMEDDSDLESLESSSEVNSASTVSPFSEANPSSQEEYLVVNTATGVCIKKYKGEEKELVVPCEINGMPVTEIGEAAFGGNKTIESIVLPDTLEKIGRGAFLFCVNLNDVSIPDSVNWIGSEAFEFTPWLDAQTEDFVIVGNGILLKYNGSAIEDVEIPEGVLMIADAFAGIHAFRSVILPDSLRVIGQDAFNYCLDLQAIEFPENLERIEDAAFENCACLRSIQFPESLNYIGQNAFAGCESLYNVVFNNYELSVQICLNSFLDTPLWDSWIAENQTITWACEKPAWLKED